MISESDLQVIDIFLYENRLRLQLFLQLVDESIVDVGVDVNALDGAAALPSVEHRPIYKLSGNIFQVSVCTHVCRVVATQL